MLQAIPGNWFNLISFNFPQHQGSAPMTRTQFVFFLSLLFGICPSHAEEPLRITPDMSREERTRIANELRERNKREMELNQRGFREHQPTGIAPATSTKFAISNAQICRAVISVLMNQPVHIIRLNSESSTGEITTIYVSPQSQKVFQNRCKIEGKSVRWGTLSGRWRDHPMDEKVTYTVSSGSVSVKVAHSDGSSSNYTVNP